MEALLRRTLAVYRMVFGQSRQEDLVSYLLTQLQHKTRSPIWSINFGSDLSPTNIADGERPETGNSTDRIGATQPISPLTESHGSGVVQVIKDVIQH